MNAMAGNTVYVQGNYVDVHDNEVVNLNIDKATVKVQENGEVAEGEEQETALNPLGNNNRDRDEKQFQFIHYSIPKEEGWTIHDEIKNLVTRQKIQMICKCLMEMHNDKKLLLPSENPSVVYKELVRMGMPNGKGFSEVTFRKYYMTKK